MKYTLEIWMPNKDGVWILRKRFESPYITTTLQEILEWQRSQWRDIDIRYTIVEKNS